MDSADTHPEKPFEHNNESVFQSEVRAAAETKLTRKIDLRLLPILTLLYLLSFLDRCVVLFRLCWTRHTFSLGRRTNVGNASVDGLSMKIHLVGGEYNGASILSYHHNLIVYFSIQRDWRYILLDARSDVALAATLS